MPLPLDARFGLDSGPNELDARELELVLNALRNQRMYSLRLAFRNREPEAEGRNRVNALEIEVLARKIEAAKGDTRGLILSPLRKES